MYATVSLLKPYASSVATSKLWGIQSKAFDKSVKTVPTTLLLSNLFLHSSKSLIRRCYLLKVLRYAEINDEK